MQGAHSKAAGTEDAVRSRCRCVSLCVHVDLQVFLSHARTDGRDGYIGTH